MKTWLDAVTAVSEKPNEPQTTMVNNTRAACCERDVRMLSVLCSQMTARERPWLPLPATDTDAESGDLYKSTC